MTESLEAAMSAVLMQLTMRKFARRGIAFMAVAGCLFASFRILARQNSEYFTEAGKSLKPEQAYRERRP
jgi:hypothetical protein